ncbi:Piwi domain-containing protein [Amanita rubescens]|nr:Piwi domain-containing protein [Amanita rubescens]
MSYSGFRDTRRISELTKSDPTFRSLRLFAKQLKFTIDLPGAHQGGKPKLIADLVPDSEISVADHFYRTYQVTVPPKTLGIKTKSGSVFPITVCWSVEQLYRGKSAPQVVSELMRVMPQTPRERMSSINDSWKYLQYAQSGFMIQAGLSVKKDPLPVKGGDSKGEIVPHRKAGVWDVMRRKFFRPGNVDSWTVVCFESRAQGQVLERFVDGLVQEMRSHGMNVSKPSGISTPRIAHGNVTRKKAQSVTPNYSSLFFQKMQKSYETPVKRFGDIEMGVPTQCVRWSDKRVREIMNNKINQYHNNLILKINTRIGGINFVPGREWFKEPTMVFGADVSHPGPGSHQPSISALVGSVDPWYTRYIATTRVQDPRLEMIEDMESMFDDLLERFKRVNKTLPRRIVFYRDGVSEGEFSQVDQVEIPRMAAVVNRKYGTDPGKWPWLCFIVVGKKHHQRFFPRDEEGRDRNGNENLYPGYVVDVDIVHPVYPDFYLQSQAGLKGTSRPSHYTVIKATKIGVDELQEFTYNLCHCYLRATRSVKIPAPVYYADLVCGRAKFHFDDNASISGDSTSSGEFDLESWRRNYAPIHERMATTMYWI